MMPNGSRFDFIAVHGLDLWAVILILSLGGQEACMRWKDRQVDTPWGHVEPEVGLKMPLTNWLFSKTFSLLRELKFLKHKKVEG